MTMIATLETILEHGSHAWRALETSGVVPENPDGPWPPDVAADAPPIARSLAAMLRYTKRLYDELAQPGEPG